MDIAILIMLALLIGLVIWLAVRSGSSQGLDEMAKQFEARLKSIEEGRREDQKLLNERLTENARAVERFGKTMGERLAVVGNVQQSLARLDEANKKIFDVGKDIAGLEKLLSAPKLRGGLGEFFLGDMLGQIFPTDCYNLQHTFKSGKRVDAVVKLGGRLAPIDAKFPMESFRRMIDTEDEAERKKAYREFVTAVKKQVNEIADSYILPDEDTFDFALMYIPAENVYYETIIKDEKSGNESIAAYALKRNVIPVSPNNLYAYLQTIIMGLKGMRIEKRATEVMQLLGRLNREFDKFTEDFRLLGGHLQKAQAKYIDSEGSRGQFADKLKTVAQLKEGEPESESEIALPESEE